MLPGNEHPRKPDGESQDWDHPPYRGGTNGRQHLCDRIHTGVSEENEYLMLTCLVPSKDDPLKFVFWKKRLRDLREDIKKDALAKLKAECPTLFNMGWFKVGANYI